MLKLGQFPQKLKKSKEKPAKLRKFLGFFLKKFLLSKKEDLRDYILSVIFKKIGLFNETLKMSNYNLPECYVHL